MDNVIGLNSSTMIEMWLNNNQIYTDALWYGVKFSGSATTGTRTGNTYMHKNLPVQSNMKGCTITSDGVVKYLKATDWTKYEDGTSRDAALNTMVEIPDHSILLVASDSDVEIRISPYRLPGFTPVKKQYVSAYEAYSNGSKLQSIKGVTPTVNTTRETFQNLARANGNLHWNMYTYEAHKAITWLFVTEYANRNCQANYISSLTSEGYHQGGLGVGVTTGTSNGAYSFVPTGTTDSLGNNTGVVSYNSGYITVSVPRYRGIENPFGHIWKNVIDVIITGTDNKVYINRDYTKFSNSTSDCELQSFTNYKSSGYLSSLVNNSAADLFCGAASGSANTYYCDYLYTNAVASDRTLLIGGSSDYGSYAGLFYLYSSDGVGSADASVGSRLTYLT